MSCNNNTTENALTAVQILSRLQQIELQLANIKSQATAELNSLTRSEINELSQRVAQLDHKYACISTPENIPGVLTKLDSMDELLRTTLAVIPQYKAGVQYPTGSYVIMNNSIAVSETSTNGVTTWTDILATTRDNSANAIKILNSMTRLKTTKPSLIAGEMGFYEVNPGLIGLAYRANDGTWREAHIIVSSTNG